MKASWGALGVSRLRQGPPGRSPAHLHPPGVSHCWPVFSSSWVQPEARDPGSSVNSREPINSRHSIHDIQQGAGG